MNTVDRSSEEKLHADMTQEEALHMVQRAGARTSKELGTYLGKDRDELREILYERDAEIASMAQKTASDEAVLGAMAVWLEQNQPDVFRRGLWGAISAARKGPFQLDAHTPETSEWRAIDTLQPTIDPPTYVIGAEEKPDGSYVVGEIHWTAGGWYWAQTDPTDNCWRRVDVSFYMPLPKPPSQKAGEQQK